MKSPPVVAEVALDLAAYGAGRVGRELNPAIRVEAVDRLQQAQHGDLDQVVEGLASIGESSGDGPGQTGVGHDHRCPPFGVLFVCLFGYSRTCPEFGLNSAGPWGAMEHIGHWWLASH